MLKKFVQLSFLLIGGTLGEYYIYHIYLKLYLLHSPFINNPYVSAILGVIIFFFLNLFLTEPIKFYRGWKSVY